MATNSEREVFASSILSPIGRQAERLSETEVTGFLAMAGKAYVGELMVVGRAVNGWVDGICADQLREPGKVTQYAELVQESVAGNGDCPMRWVTNGWGASEDYNTKRSAFWRCIQSVAMNLDIVDFDSTDWSSHLVWSNLYKVSPAAGGNPNNALCEAQLAGCVDLFNLELQTYRPSRVLLLTGDDWAAPFVTGADLQGGDGFDYIKQYGRFHAGDDLDTSCVIAVHPQGKSEADWVREVVTAFTGEEGAD